MADQRDIEAFKSAIRADDALATRPWPGLTDRERATAASEVLVERLMNPSGIAVGHVGPEEKS